MKAHQVSTFCAPPGAVYSLQLSRSRPWGVYWEHAPTLKRWFSTRKMADAFAQVNFRGSLYFIEHARFPREVHPKPRTGASILDIT